MGEPLALFAVSTARARHGSSHYMGNGAAHYDLVASEQARLPPARRLGPHLIQRIDKALVRATLGSAYWVWYAGGHSPYGARPDSAPQSWVSNGVEEQFIGEFVVDPELRGATGSDRAGISL